MCQLSVVRNYSIYPIGVILKVSLKHLSLFSGIGGLDLAAEWAGFETVGQCEWADFQTKVLQKHWPGVPRWRDIRTLTKDSFYERTGLRTVDIISGGFPCQPFSVAGKQKGKWDDRYLWPDMLRIIRELAPRWVVGENVPGILRLAAADVVADLEREGYDVAVFDFEAAAVGALHRRERIAFVANASGEGLQRCQFDRTLNKARFEKSFRTASKCGCAVSDADGVGLERVGRHTEKGCDNDKKHPFSTKNIRDARTIGRWSVEPDVGRVAHGVPNRVDRLKCLGNAVVPQQFFPIFKAIYDLEEELCVSMAIAD